MKHLKVGRYELYAAAIIAVATGLRMFLIAMNWPPTNSDEGVMGIIALHIAYHGEYPWIFYGQDYMGTLEAYLGAFFFHLFGGPSLFALRFGVVLLIMLFFICQYLLTSLVFTKKLALVTLALLSFGSIPYLERQTLATGGSSETLLFGTLSFLFATWLALTYRRKSTFSTKGFRLMAYFGMGLVIGLATWSDMVVAPVLAMAGLLLLIFCWRDLFLIIFGMVSGFLVGFAPSLRYSMLHQLNPITTLLSLFHGLDAHPSGTLQGYLHGIKETILVSIPTATGNPFCPVQELTFLSDNSPRTPTCETIHVIWGFGYLAFLGLAIFTTLTVLWHMRTHFQTIPVEERHQQLVRYVTRLLMLSVAVLTILTFAFSSAPVMWPAFHARYLLTLVIIFPAVLEVIWNTAYNNKNLASNRIRMVISRSLLVISLLISLSGTLIAASEISAARQSTQNYMELIQHLIPLGVKHIKSDYWSCYNISFLSNERLPCAVMTDELHAGYDRVPHYYDMAQADPHTAYVINLPSEIPALLKLAHKSRGTTYNFNGYIVFIPS